MNRTASLIAFAFVSSPAIAMACINTLYYQTAFATRVADYSLVGMLLAAGVIAVFRARGTSSVMRELGVTFSGVIGGLGLGLLLSTHEGFELNGWVWTAGSVFLVLLFATYMRKRTPFVETELESGVRVRVARVGLIISAALVISALGTALLLDLRRQAQVTAEPESFRTSYPEYENIVF